MRPQIAYAIILTSVCACVAAKFLEGPNYSLDLDEAMMERLLGGDANTALCRKRCDVDAGVFMGCTAPMTTCQECRIQTATGSFAPLNERPGTPGMDGCTTYGYYRVNEAALFINCGTFWTGFCDPNLVCQAANSGTPCPLGQKPLKPQ